MTSCSTDSGAPRNLRVYRKQPCPFCEGRRVQVLDGDLFECETCNQQWRKEDETL